MPMYRLYSIQLLLDVDKTCGIIFVWIRRRYNLSFHLNYFISVVWLSLTLHILHIHIFGICLAIIMLSLP